MSVPHQGFSDAERTVYPLPFDKEWGLVRIPYLNYCLHSNTALGIENARLRERAEIGVSCSGILKALYKEREDICTTLSKLREEKERLSDELQGLCEHEELAIAMEELKEEKEKEIADLRNHNQNLLDKETDYRQEIIDLKKRITELENGGVAKEAKDVASLEENCKLKERIAELEGCFGKLKDRNKELEDLIGTQELRHTNEILQLKKTISAMEKEHDETVAADVQKIAGDLVTTQVEPLRRDLKSLEEEKKELVKLNKSLEAAQVKLEKETTIARTYATAVDAVRKQQETYLKVAEPIINDLIRMLMDAIEVSNKDLNVANMNSDQLRLMEFEVKVSNHAMTIGERAGMPMVFKKFQEIISGSIQKVSAKCLAALDAASFVDDGPTEFHASVSDPEEVSLPKMRRVKKQAVRTAFVEEGAARTPSDEDDDTPLLRQAP